MFQPSQPVPQTKKFYDFNHKNIGLIASVFAVLVIFMFAQGNLFGAVTKLGFTLGKYNSVFAVNSPSASSGAVLGASVLSKNIESQMSALPIQFAYQDTVAGANTYIQQVQIVNSADSSNPVKLSRDLLAIAVPPTVARYQRLIIIRAELQAQLQGASSDQQVQIEANLAAVSQAISEQQSSFAAQNVNLPS